MPFQNDDICEGSQTKDGNQAIKADAGKPQLTLVPTSLVPAVAAVRMHGVKKYLGPLS